MPRNELKIVLMNVGGVPNAPDAIIVRISPRPWRKGCLPVLRAVAADLAGRPVRWADIYVHEGMTEEDWDGFVERKRTCLYRSDSPGHLERVQ